MLEVIDGAAEVSNGRGYDGKKKKKNPKPEP
jgi:hypothetical protein